MIQLIILFNLVLWSAVLSGCTCGGYHDADKQFFYCSSKNITDLHIKHGDSSLDLGNADNQAGETIEHMLDKIPIL
jgi:hypothetical protein